MIYKSRIFISIFSMEGLLSSGYFEKMGTVDKIARRIPTEVKTLDDLRDYYSSRIFPAAADEDVRVLKSLRSDLNDLLRSRKWGSALSIKYDCLLSKSDLENGLPHTHGTAIILPQEYLRNTHYDSLFKTFVHEFIHVYQRLYPIETHGLLRKWGYKPYLTRERFAQIYISSLNLHPRLNPDINEIVYKGPDDNVQCMVYSSNEPKSLNDCITLVVKAVDDVDEVSMEVATRNNKTEHPYEYMAYTLADVLVDAKQEPAFDEWVLQLVKK